MATRTIVTFHPDVACDVCGRRLLRGEQPDVFLSGGQRRMVCELCTPRATHEGWRRETEEPATAPRSAHPQRGRSLLDRLRQSRRATSDRSARPVRAATFGGDAPSEDGWTAVDRDWAGADDRASADIGSGADIGARADDRADTNRTWAVAAQEPGADTTSGGDAPGGGTRLPDEGPDGASRDAGLAVAGGVQADADASVKWALDVFNAGGEPRRIAGVARALGPPCVKATAVAGPGEVVAIVVAWELCWYRYEIDLHNETAGARLTAEGMELNELAPEDRTANATADERGELSLLNAS